jgi:hypothetical protein
VRFAALVIYCPEFLFTGWEAGGAPIAWETCARADLIGHVAT